MKATIEYDPRLHGKVLAALAVFPYQAVVRVDYGSSESVAIKDNPFPKKPLDIMEFTAYKDGAYIGTDDYANEPGILLENELMPYWADTDESFDTVEWSRNHGYYTA